MAIYANITSEDVQWHILAITQCYQVMGAVFSIKKKNFVPSITKFPSKLLPKYHQITKKCPSIHLIFPAYWMSSNWGQTS
jgi:hypothetical protein